MVIQIEIQCPNVFFIQFILVGLTVKHIYLYSAYLHHTHIGSWNQPVLSNAC